MINDQLLSYIKQQLALNVSRELISSNLKSSGWTETDISEAFAVVSPVVNPLTQTAVPTPVVNSEQASNIIRPEVGPSYVTSQEAEKSINSFQPEHRKSKKILYAILILILFVVLGGGAYAYYSGFFVSLPVLTSQAIDSMRAAKSANYDVTVNVDLSQIDTSGQMGQFFLGGINAKQFNITSKGAYDKSNSENFMGSSVISANMGSFSLGAEFRVLNKTFYAVLTKVPTLAFIPTLSGVENKWVSLPLESNSGQVVDNPLTMMSPISPDIINKLTDEQKEHIYQISRNAHFVKAVKKLTPETIGGELSYHFVFDLDREGIIAYTKSLKDYVNSIGKNDSALTSFNPTITMDNLNEIKDFNGEIWIGRNDKLLHKFIINFGTQPDKTKAEQIKINVVGIFSGWNQPVSIVAPAESVSLDTFMSSIMGDARERGADASIKANMANMRFQGEIFYDSKFSYSGFCASKDVINAGKSIETAHENDGTKMICKDSTKAWAAQAKLVLSGNYWCVDSTGVSAETKTALTNTKCPAAIPAPSSPNDSGLINL